MSCIHGDAIVHVNRAGKGFTQSLRELCYKSLGGEDRGRKWDLDISTCIRGFRGGHLGLTRLEKVQFGGKRETVRVTTQHGRSIQLTASHKVCTGGYRCGQYTTVANLKVGDTILTSAPSHFRPTSTAIVQLPPSQIKKTTRLGAGHWIDNDGYIRVGGLKDHPRHSTHGVYEHLLVIEEAIGRPVQVGEEVHHVNGQRWDNRLENLLWCRTRADHMKHHDFIKNLHRGRNLESTCVYCDRVVAITDEGYADVYNVLCEGPYYNFVADGVIVQSG